MADTRLNVLQHFDLPPFRPLPLWRGGDLQTLRNWLKPPRETLDDWPGEELIFSCLDGSGDRLSAKLHRPEEGGHRPLILLVHGLSGSEDSFYVRVSAAHLLRAGYPVLRLNLRGAGPGRRPAASRRVRDAMARPAPGETAAHRADAAHRAACPASLPWQAPRAITGSDGRGLAGPCSAIPAVAPSFAAQPAVVQAAPLVRARAPAGAAGTSRRARRTLNDKTLPNGSVSAHQTSINSRGGTRTRDPGIMSAVL